MVKIPVNHDHVIAPRCEQFKKKVHLSKLLSYQPQMAETPVNICKLHKSIWSQAIMYERCIISLKPQQVYIFCKDNIFCK